MGHNKKIVLGKIKENEDKKENKYGVYSYLGENLIPCSLDSCYSTVSAGVTTYYMEYKGETINVEEYIGRVLGLSSDLTEEEN